MRSLKTSDSSQLLLMLLPLFIFVCYDGRTTNQPDIAAKISSIFTSNECMNWSGSKIEFQQKNQGKFCASFIVTMTTAWKKAKFPPTACSLFRAFPRGILVRRSTSFVAMYKWGMYACARTHMVMMMMMMNSYEPNISDRCDAIRANWSLFVCRVELFHTIFQKRFSRILSLPVLSHPCTQTHTPCDGVWV